MLTTISLSEWMSSRWAFVPTRRQGTLSRNPTWSQECEDVIRGGCERDEDDGDARETKSPYEVYLQNAAPVAFLLLEQVLSSQDSPVGTLEMNNITVTLHINQHLSGGKAHVTSSGDDGSDDLPCNLCVIKSVNVVLLNDDKKQQPPLFQSLAAVLAKLFTCQESLPGWEAILPRQNDELCDGADNNDEEFESAMLKALSILDADGGHQGPQRPRQPRHNRESNTFERTCGQFPALPSFICRLISDLIDAPLKTETAFASLGDVLDDLEQMAKEPGTFLHDPRLPSVKLDFGARLYGRNQEVSQLMDIANAISSRREDGPLEVITIGGYSGSGKSSLVRQVGRHLSSKGWVFIQGKFDRMRQSGAFSVVTSALESYCGKIEAMKNQGVQADLNYCAQVSAAVMDALGHAGAIYLSQIIPGLRNVVELGNYSEGGSRLAPIQTPDEAIMSQQRREYSLCAFVEAIAGAGRPIILFYDDLQWADSSSSYFLHKLIKHLADRSKARKSIMFALSFRDNEVNETDPMHLLTSGFLDHGAVNATRIMLGGFSKGALNDILSPILGLPRRITSPVSEIIHQKTAGNAFFVIEFMKTLESPDKKLLTYSLAKRRWTWDADSIAVMTISDSVAGLLVKKLLCVEKDMLDSLIIAACFGSQVNTAVMKLLNGMKGVASVVQNLDAAVDEGLLEKAGPLYMFSHDSIQQSVYDLIPKNELLQLHVDIGLMLISNSSRVSRDLIEEIFSFAVSHINMALPHEVGNETTIEFTPSQRIVFAKLNLKAGQKAANGKSDFSLAEVHLKAGIQFLQGQHPGEAWTNHYDLTLQIFDDYIYVLYVQRKHEELHSYVEIILKNATSIHDKIKAHELMISVLTLEGFTQDALDYAKTVLDSLGFPFPSSVDSETVSGVFTSLSSTILTYTPDHLRAFPPMTEKVPLHAMKILSAIHMPYSFSKPTMYQMMACQMMQLTMKHGLCVESAEAFASYGYCLNVLFQSYDVGYRLGQLSLVILERFKATKRLAKVYFTVYGFLSVWKEPLQATVEALEFGIKTGLSEGDYQNAQILQVVVTRQMFLAGFDLPSIRDRIFSLCRDMMLYNSKKKIHPSFPTLVGDLYSVMAFTGEPEDEVSSIFGTSEENETRLWQHYNKSHNAPMAQMVYYHRFIKSFWFRDYELAIKSCKKYESYTVECKVLRSSDIYRHFFYGLSSLILSRRKNDKDLIAQGKEMLTGMQLFAKRANKWNGENKALLLEAEYNFAIGNNEKAKIAYEQSIQSAQQHKFIHEEALACELYGIFSVEVGDLHEGNELLEQARKLYVQWGAQKKADLIFSL